MISKVRKLTVIVSGMVNKDGWGHTVVSNVPWNRPITRLTSHQDGAELIDVLEDGWLVPPEGSIRKALTDDTSLSAVRLLVNKSEGVRGAVDHGTVELGLLGIATEAIDVYIVSHIPYVEEGSIP